MTLVTFEYLPKTQKALEVLPQVRCVLQIDYRMFPELAEDFDSEEFQQHQDIEMKPTDSSYKRLTAKKLLPYGTITR